MAPSSALPTAYYAIFGFYEPALCLLGFLGAILDPKATHDMQAPSSAGAPAQDILPLASFVTIIQLGHVCALLGVLNIFILGAARKHLAPYPALQEKIVAALFTPLLIGDVTHLITTFWAIGEGAWNWREWEPTLWIVVVTGISLFVPRLCWHCGVGRYMHLRDGLQERKHAGLVEMKK